MSAHLREAWSRLVTAAPFYHGTNRAAYDEILRDGNFLRSEPRAVSHEIERRYGLPPDSVWNFKYNEFSRGRASDPNVYFHSDRHIAQEYAELGSEVIFDALSAAWHLLFDPFDEEGNYKPGMPEARKQWIAEETRKHYKPVVLKVEIPDAPYDEGTIFLPAPIPSSWIVDVEQL